MVLRQTYALFLAVAAAAPDAGVKGSASANPALFISGTAAREQVTYPCLGGVAVSEEMIQRERTPLARQTLTVFSGSTPAGRVVTWIKTDRSGRFSIQLAPGTYCVVLGERARVPPSKAEPKTLSPQAPSTEPNLDPECLYRLAHPAPTCDAHLPVPDHVGRPLEIVIYSANQCPQQWAHPCWRGPMPP